MATAEVRAPGGAQAAAFIQERFGITWGNDVIGIAEGGFTAESADGEGGLFRLTLIGTCTKADVQRFIDLLWSKPVSALPITPEGDNA